MEPEKHEMVASDFDNETVLVESERGLKTIETMEQNGRKKPEVPPKPIVREDNLKYRERTVIKRYHNSELHEMRKSASAIRKKSVEEILYPSIKHTSIYKENQENLQMELKYTKGACSPSSERLVLKPPLLPKPSLQLYQSSPVNFASGKQKLPENTCTSVRSYSYSVNSVELKNNEKETINLMSNADNVVDVGSALSDAVITDKSCNVPLDDKYYSRNYESDKGIKSVYPEQDNTVSADCSMLFSRCHCDETICCETSVQHTRTTSMPNIYFGDKILFINTSSKVLSKQYQGVNAVCDTFYPTDLLSPCMKCVCIIPNVRNYPSVNTSWNSEDSGNNDMCTCNTEHSTTLRHNSSFSSCNVKSLEVPLKNVSISGCEDYSGGIVKSKSTHSVSSSLKNNSKFLGTSTYADSGYVDFQTLSTNLQNTVSKPFSRRYSLPPGYKARLQDKLRPQSWSNTSLFADNRKKYKTLHTKQCSKSVLCSCTSGGTSSEYKESKFSLLLEKFKPVKEVKRSSTFYFQHDLPKKEVISGGCDVSAGESISEPEEISSNQNFFHAVDINRPASGLSGMFESDDNNDPTSSEMCFSVQDISDSDNDESLHAIALTDTERREKKAFYIVRELVTSEKVFIDVLRLLTEDFKNAVQVSEKVSKCNIIPEESISKILNSLPQLRHLNEDLLNDLENRINNWHTIKKISDVIVKKGPFLKLYSTYIQNFELQCNYLDECCSKYPKFAKVVKEFEASPRCKKLSIKHYMIKPVQRIPQYRLILSDYLSTQNCDSPDYEDTKTALKIVCEVADHANRRLKLGDGLKKLMQLQTMLRNYEIIKPGRDLVKDGELFKLSRKVMQPRYFILLNDCLLCTSYVGSSIHSAESVKVNYELPLDDLKVSVPKTEAYENEFSIISTRRSFRLSARSSEERDEWVRSLKDAIREYEKRKESFKRKPCDSFMPYEELSFPAFKLGKDAPVWVHDFRVTRCQSCTELFTVTFRRHHCRACGKVVCGNCSENRAPLEYKKYNSSRVCGDCFENLLREFEESPPLLSYNELATIQSRFVKKGETVKKKYVPERLLEVTANDTKSQMSGWLQKRSRRSWKRYWFVLKNQVLYAYKASEDVVALESIPVLGYEVVSLKETLTSLYEGVDKNLVFQLHHVGQTPITFYADNEQIAAKWICALEAQSVI